MKPFGINIEEIKTKHAEYIAYAAYTAAVNEVLLRYLKPSDAKEIVSESRILAMNSVEKVINENNIKGQNKIQVNKVIKTLREVSLPRKVKWNE